MPENISVVDFLKEAWDDFNSPTTSTFMSKLSLCRATVASLEDTLDFDRSGLNKLKKSMKALYSSGNVHTSNDSYLADNLHRMGQSLQKEQENIGDDFLKFAVIIRELSALMKNLMQNMNNILMFPLDSFLKGDLSGIKGDLKKPFDKASKDFDVKFSKIAKEKKDLARDAGMIKTEITGAEVAEEVEKERRMFQLQMCEYLIRVNEIKTKKGVDLLQHLVDYYQAQNNFFQDGLKTVEHYRCYIGELVTELNRLRQKQDAERRNLIELREALRQFMSTYKEASTTPQPGYSLHQLQGNKAHGFEKQGFLLKKSEGKMRKVWQKRRCTIKDGILSIGHSDLTKEPVKLNLLTCQVKLVNDDPGKKCFDLISSSKNRTYHFQADDSQDMEEWISVLNNAKESVLMKAFSESSSTTSGTYNQSVKELTRTILTDVRRMPGNSICCDCSAPDPEWLSVNLGVLICLECCGVHRDMGVHISRTQSTVIDDLGTAQLLLARVMSNRGFNDIMEATLDLKNKPTPRSTMEERKTFIRGKYEKRRYAIITCADIEDRRQDLKQSILTKDIQALLQVFAEGIDFMEPLPDMPKEENALHLAIQQEEDNSLYMVDFIIQNTNSQDLGRRTIDGNTALHLCVLENKTDCMKLLLRAQPDLKNYGNVAGQTALDVATSLGHSVCLELLNHALEGKSEMFEQVNIDWGFMLEEYVHDGLDYSDDELDILSAHDARKPRSRPGSLVLSSEISVPGLSYSHKERSLTTDNLRLGPTSSVPAPPATGRQKLPSTSSNQLSVSTSSSISHNFANSASGSSSIAANNLSVFRKKAPAPPPPAGSGGARKSHMRNPSDPGFSHFHNRSPSDSQPPLPNKNPRIPSGAELVIPAPPEFGSSKPPVQAKSFKSITRPVDDDAPNIPPALPPKPATKSYLQTKNLEMMVGSSTEVRRNSGLAGAAEFTGPPIPPLKKVNWSILLLLLIYLLVYYYFEKNQFIDFNS